MIEKIPVNLEVLKWARETSGFSLDEISKQFPKLSSWETGQDMPTYNQLETLAKKYHRPIAIFFFPKPPDEEKIEKSLRAISDDEVNNLSPQLRKLFRKAKAFQLNLQELLESEKDKHLNAISWLQNLKNLSLDETAKKVRQLLKVPLDEQLSWKNSDVALENWRNILAAHGIFVFKEAFKSDRVSGFCIYDKLFPIIFINNSQAKNRQIFTIFHELAHIIFHESYLDIFDERFWKLEKNDPKHIEVKCNAFAANFLVPDFDFDKRIKGVQIDDDLLKQFVERYHVSREVILRRLLEKQKITQKYFYDKLSEWRNSLQENSVDEEKGGGNYYHTKIVYLGKPYISLVLSKYNQGKFPSEKAAEYLDSKLKTFGTLEEKFLRKEASNVRF